ncbi:MAG: hypothetical protein HRT98_04080 [Mycoplasmatales bacterium]|nr:hypothetical protein [Mycoplasmatales bacterium]
MKLNKKILLRSSIAPLVIATPVVIAVSCGNSIVNSKTIDKKHDKVVVPKQKNVQAYTAAIELNNFFGDFLSKFKGKAALRAQAQRTSDYALVAFIGYLESDATDIRASDTAKLKAKKKFSEDLINFKFQLDKLIDMAITNPESATNILSPLLKELVSSLKLGGNGQIEKFGTIIIENILKKMKMVMDNTLDTLINIEYPKTPDFIKNKNTKPIGSLEDIKNNKKSEIKYDEILKAFNKPFSDKVLFKQPSHDYDLVQQTGFLLGLAKSVIGGTVIKNVGGRELKGSAWQVGVNHLKEEVKLNPAKIQVFKNETTKEIYFKINETTTKLANTIKSELKFNEKHIESLIDDRFFENIKPLLLKLIKHEGIGLGDISMISKIMGDKEAIKGIFEKVELILEDFGKTLQFTEVNLQMLVSHLMGDTAQFYGGMTKTGRTYTLKPETFTTPQLNVYNYKNYKPYVDTIDQKTLDDGIKVSVKVPTATLKFNVLKILKNITRDPLSNYTVGIFQIAQLLTKDMKDINI